MNRSKPVSSHPIAATVVYPHQDSELNARLLIDSIRAFGGSLSGIPLWCFVPQAGKEPSKSFRNFLDAAGVRYVPFEVSGDILGFPLAADVAAAARAETDARNHADLLVWIGANTLVFQEPRHFLIPDERDIGYRPVHHINIGSLADQPLDPFWSLIYQTCRVPSDRVFTMKTHVDDKKIRPYFNAGSLVIRPERGLFAAWQDIFFDSFHKPAFQELYQHDERYAIFMHQAVLSGVIMSTFRNDELLELPPTYNYPLHLWNEDITSNRPRTLSNVVTARHEGFYRDAEWQKKMPEGNTLKQWLAERIADNQPTE